MKDFAEEKDVTYKFRAGNKYVSDSLFHQGSSSLFEGFSFQYLKTQINAGQPMHVGVKFKTSPDVMGGHSIVAFGYQDNPGTDNDWIAVNDTWVDGPATGGYPPIPNKVEDGIELWQWVTDTDEDFYIYRGGWLVPAIQENSVWGILESTFSSETAFEEQFQVTAGDSGGASLVTLVAASEETAVRLLADGAVGNDDCLLTTWIPMAEQLDVSFDYAFETAGTMQLLINGELMAELTDLSGLGVVDEPGDFQSFSEEFIVSDWGLDPSETYELELRLLAGSTHVAFLDNLQVINPGATFVPEPSTFILLIMGAVGLLAYGWRRRRKTA
ncbi:MAG: PEP-CTERM sorting domain-containing protein [Candidatus Nealsonbacteria bacterium]|nr:PEP-CTERM sorting domain-containing protein [Candidatus Nealsonbacteria bacterium]